MAAAEPRTEPDVAVMSASPSLMPVTRPVASTVATDGLLLANDTSASEIGLPRSSNTVATTRIVSPATTAISAGSIVTLAGTNAGGGAGSTGGGSVMLSPPQEPIASAMPATRVFRRALKAKAFRRLVVSDRIILPNWISTLVFQVVTVKAKPRPPH